VDPRSSRAFKNIIGLVAIRGTSALLNLALVPIAISSLSPFEYGIWAALTSILNWISFADLGLGNGMRNKFSEAIALGEMIRARSYVSTTYVMVGSVVVVFISTYWISSPLIPWARVLNIVPERADNLPPLAAVVFVAFSLRLIFSLIGTVFIARQDPAVAGILDLVTNAITLGIVIILVNARALSLLGYGIVVSCVSMIVPLAAHAVFLFHPYKEYRPSLRLFDLRYAKNLFSLGWQFFLLQLASLAIFASTNLLIIRMFGPTEVTSFNVSFRYFNTAGMAFTIILMPFWSAFSDAYTRGDLRWISTSIRRLKYLWGGLALGTILMTIVSSSVYRLWVGPGVTVGLPLSIALAFYTIISGWCAIFANLLNGLGKIRLQLFVAVASAFAMVPLAIAFGRTLGFGPAGVILASCVCLLPGCFLWPIQTRKILLRSAKEIWTL